MFVKQGTIFQSRDTLDHRKLQQLDSSSETSLSLIDETTREAEGPNLKVATIE